MHQSTHATTPVFSTAALGMVLIASSCATPGAAPHDVSAERHAAAAAHEDVAAVEHHDEFDPNAAVPQTRCRAHAAADANTGNDGVCWTSTTNPSDVHERATAEHRRHAADHRAASAALREAEATACLGLSEDDRDMSPFEHTEDIASVTPLLEHVQVGKISRDHVVGAVVTFRALPGLTAEWLQRVVDCHLARNASLGHVVTEMPNCPLVPKDVEAKVSSTGAGFAVAIQAKDPKTADEILARARRLLPASTVSKAE